MLGSTKGVSLRLFGSFSALEKSILSAALCRDKYFVCARTLHPDRTWATDSWALPHILHFWSGSSVVLVFLELYSLVGSSCSYSSIIPAIVCVGEARHSVIQEKHSPSSFSSSQRTVISFPCHFFSLVSSKRLRCTAFFAHTPIFRPSITSPYFVVPDGSGHLSSSFIPSSSANLFASSIKECRPVLRAFSSNSLTSSIVGSELLYSLTAALTLVSLYSASIDLSPLPPTLLGR